MKIIKSNKGFVDLYAGRFPLIFGVSSLFVILITFFYNDDFHVDFFYMSHWLPSELMAQFNIIAENRINAGRSIVLMKACVIMSIFCFALFVYTIPSEHVKIKYLRENVFRSYIALVFSISFFFLVVMMALYHTFVVESWEHPKGRYKQIIVPVIKYDLGLSLIFLALLLVTAYCISMFVKSIFVHVKTIGEKS